jgi:hypothetical protein
VPRMDTVCRIAKARGMRSEELFRILVRGEAFNG